MSLKLVSNDSRRSLFEFGEGNWKIGKYIEVKEDSELGNHFHKEKDECFLLIEGEIKELELDNLTLCCVKAPFSFTVPKGMRHRFSIKAGSKLIGLQSELYNPQD